MNILSSPSESNSCELNVLHCFVIICILRSGENHLLHNFAHTLSLCPSLTTDFSLTAHTDKTSVMSETSDRIFSSVEVTFLLGLPGRLLR